MSTNKALKNTIFNLISLGATSLLAFIIRTFLIKYLGAVVLGVNATIVDTLNLLSISELGIQTSISYKMYKPIIDNDLKRQQELFNLYKIAYRIVGIAIFVIGCVLLPFIKRIVNTDLSMSIVYSAYLIQLISIALNYMLSYYRMLFIVHQEQYVCTRYDLVLNICTYIIQIVILILFKNYILYLTISYINVIGSFVLIKLKSKREYSMIIQKTKVQKKDIKELFLDMKEMLAGTLSGYVYGSTDSVLISYFFGSLITGFVSNYKMITQMMKSIMTSICTAVTPTWGDFLNRGNSPNVIKQYYDCFIFIEYLICSVLLIPTMVLLSDFIELMFGTQYVISDVIVCLIVMDIFMSAINEPTCIIMRNLGMFKEEKIVSTIAAIVNISSSIILANLIGVSGIFIGTILAVIVYWIIRSLYVNKRIFNSNKEYYAKFWIYNFAYVFIFLIISFVLINLFKYVSFDNKYLQFIIRGLLSELIILIINLLIWVKSNNFRMVFTKIKSVVSEK